MWNALIVGLIGIWMVIAPFATMSSGGNAVNDWIVGIVAAILGFSISAEHAWQRPLAGIVGIWLFISGFIASLHMGRGLQTNDIVMGILLIIAGFAAMSHHHAGHVAPPQAAH